LTTDVLVRLAERIAERLGLLPTVTPERLARGSSSSDRLPRSSQTPPAGSPFPNHHSGRLPRLPWGYEPFDRDPNQEPRRTRCARRSRSRCSSSRGGRFGTTSVTGPMNRSRVRAVLGRRWEEGPGARRSAPPDGQGRRWSTKKRFPGRWCGVGLATRFAARHAISPRPFRSRVRPHRLGRADYSPLAGPAWCRHEAPRTSPTAALVDIDPLPRWRDQRTPPTCSAGRKCLSGSTGRVSLRITVSDLARNRSGGPASVRCHPPPSLEIHVGTPGESPEGEVGEDRIGR
jgi:hypothetical protein